MSHTGFRSLLVYQKTLEYVAYVYKVTGTLPKSETFGLSSQMRRASVSVLSNIVEGYLKSSVKEKLRFLEISYTSLLELEAQADVCRAIGYWDSKEYEDFLARKNEVSYLIHRYIQATKLKSKSK